MNAAPVTINADSNQARSPSNDGRQNLRYVYLELLVYPILDVDMLSIFVGLLFCSMSCVLIFHECVWVFSTFRYSPSAVRVAVPYVLGNVQMLVIFKPLRHMWVIYILVRRARLSPGVFCSRDSVLPSGISVEVMAATSKSPSPSQLNARFPARLPVDASTPHLLKYHACLKPVATMPMNLGVTEG